MGGGGGFGPESIIASVQGVASRFTLWQDSVKELAIDDISSSSINYMNDIKAKSK